MQKNTLFHAVFPFLFLLCACQSGTKQSQPSHSNELSSEHVPTPLPIFPDQNETFLPDAPIDPIPPVTPVDPDVWDVSNVDISAIDHTRKLIALTFDDAPARQLESIIAVFAEYNEQNPDCVASATVFLNGCRFDPQTPTLLSAALTLGFELGNHTDTHADLTTLSIEETCDEINRVDALLCALDGKEKHLFRPPFGKITKAQKSTLSTPIISWTIDTLDWTGRNENEIYDTVMENKFSGAIVLMHDGNTPTLQALKRLLPDLKSEGYQAVSVSQMSKAHACPLKKGGEYIRIRKK